MLALFQGVRDYNVGEGPDPLAVDVCAQCGISLDQSLRARLFKPADDIVDFDLLAVMDKVLGPFLRAQYPWPDECRNTSTTSVL